MVSTPLQYRPALSRHSDEVKKSLLVPAGHEPTGMGGEIRCKGSVVLKVKTPLPPYLVSIPRQSFSFPAIL